jgi:hypothetical protein
MTCDSLVESSRALKRSVSSEKLLDTPLTAAAKATPSPALPILHKRSQSYNIEFQYNKNSKVVADFVDKKAETHIQGSE